MDTTDYLVRLYQETGECEQLVNVYHHYLMKYYKMFTQGQIDFDNYDVRKFLACFIKDAEIRKGLVRGKYRSKKAIYEAHQVVQYIRRAFRGYETYKPWEKAYPYDEIYRELTILFLTSAKNYVEQGKGFHRYLYICYRYSLKDFINSKLFDASDKKERYVDMFAVGNMGSLEEAGEIKYVDKPYPIEIDEHTDLANNVLWLNGVDCDELFQDLSYNDRLILVKAFQDKLSDKEIAQLTGLHHRSVYRIKKRLVEHFRELRVKGAIKWIR